MVQNGSIINGYRHGMSMLNLLMKKHSNMKYLLMSSSKINSQTFKLFVPLSEFILKWNHLFRSTANINIVFKFSSWAKQHSRLWVVYNQLHSRCAHFRIIISVHLCWQRWLLHEAHNAIKSFLFWQQLHVLLVEGNEEDDQNPWTDLLILFVY